MSVTGSYTFICSTKHMSKEMFHSSNNGFIFVYEDSILDAKISVIKIVSYFVDLKISSFIYILFKQ